MTKHWDRILLQDNLLGSTYRGGGYTRGVGGGKTSINKHSERQNGIKCAHAHAMCSCTCTPLYHPLNCTCVSVSVRAGKRSRLVTVRSLSYALDQPLQRSGGEGSSSPSQSQAEGLSRSSEWCSDGISGTMPGLRPSSTTSPNVTQWLYHMLVLLFLF